MADKPQTALYELLGPELQDMAGVGIQTASTLMVTPVAVPEDTRCADLDSEDAIQFGVFNELSASAYETYEMPRQWAAGFDDAGFGGIRYISRMVSGSTSASWAIFGPEGPGVNRPVAAGDARPAIDLLREMGVALFGDDLASDLTVVPVPAWNVGARSGAGR